MKQQNYVQPSTKQASKERKWTIAAICASSIAVLSWVAIVGSHLSTVISALTPGNIKCSNSFGVLGTIEFSYFISLNSLVFPTVFFILSVALAMKVRARSVRCVLTIIAITLTILSYVVVNVSFSQADDYYRDHIDSLMQCDA